MAVSAKHSIPTHRLLATVPQLNLVEHPRIARTILCLGPPHSGKSVFAYLLATRLRSIRNDTALLDCDVFSPTTNRMIAPSDRAEWVYLTPNWGKPTEDIPLGSYQGLIDTMFRTVTQRGVVIMDGVGRFTEHTRFLLTYSERVIVVCRESISPSTLKTLGYHDSGGPRPPRQLVEDLGRQVLGVTTRLDRGEAAFDRTTRSATVWGLRKSAIRNGVVDGIPAETLSVIAELAEFCDAWAKSSTAGSGTLRRSI